MFVVQALYQFKGQVQRLKDLEQDPAAPAVNYIDLRKGNMLLVRRAHESGWWEGMRLSDKVQGFFPSNYVKTCDAPKPAQQPSKQEDEMQQLVQMQKTFKRQGSAMPSTYYLGVKGYKRVKLDQKNKSILQNKYIQVDQANGVALIPIKDQNPTAKAVRHMGYYFDYHHWIDGLNEEGVKKGKADPRRKKPKRLKIREWKE